MYVEEHQGRDPATVWLHHGVGSTRAWDRFLPAGAVGAGRSSSTGDGFGRSTHDRKLTTAMFDDDVADLRAMLTERGGEPVHLVGHSDGGTVALLLAARAPDWCAASPWCRRTFAATPRPWLHSGAWVRPTSGLSRCAGASGAPTVTTGLRWRAGGMRSGRHRSGNAGASSTSSRQLGAPSTRCTRSTTTCRRRLHAETIRDALPAGADHLGRHVGARSASRPTRALRRRSGVRSGAMLSTEMAEHFNCCEWLVDRHVAAGNGARTRFVTGDATITYAELLELSRRGSRRASPPRRPSRGARSDGPEGRTRARRGDPRRDAHRSRRAAGQSAAAPRATSWPSHATRVRAAPSFG